MLRPEGKLMMKNNVQYTDELNRQTIDDISKTVQQFFSARRLDQRMIRRHALSIEEILLNHLDADESTGKVSLDIRTRLMGYFITLTVAGEERNAYLQNGGSEGILADGLLKNLGLAPDYAYNGKENVYSFFIRKTQRIRLLLKFLIILALAVAVGLLGRLLPEEIRAVILTDYLSPLRAAFLSILGCLAGPMVFLSILWGICGIGDIATLKKIGNQLILRYLATGLFCAVLGGGISLAIFRPVFSGAESVGWFSSIYARILEIIPKNLFSPFVDGNTLQIIFLAVLFGIALLFLGKRTSSITNAVRQISFVIQLVIEFISRLVPYFTFIIIVSMLWSDSAAVFSNVKSMLLVYLLAVIAAQLLILLYTAVRNRVSPLLLLKKNLATFIVAFTTASASATLNYTLRACREEFGIDESITSFGVPLGAVLHKPFTAINFFVSSVYFAGLYGVEISAGWIVSLLICSVILSSATPPIPGGALTCYAVLYTQLGIPADAIAIAAACHTILIDSVNTGFNQLSLPYCVLNLATKLGLTDREILTEKAVFPNHKQ